MKDNRSKPIFFALGVMFAIILCSFLWFFAFVLMLDCHPLHAQKMVHVAKGESLNQLSRKISSMGLVPDSIFFKYWVELFGGQHYLQSGYYKITPDMSINDLLHKIYHGENSHFKLVIIPGETTRDLQSQIKATGTGMSLKHTQTLQGTLYPNTYDYFNQQSLQQAIQKAHQPMHAYMLKVWQHRNKTLPYLNQYKVLIMASILEKEAASYQNQRHIAGVFINRMKKRMYLDSDATVRYAVHARPGELLKHSDFRSASYFNTYRYKYLPPTPIAFVSKQSIQAALHPLKTNDLYYLTKKDGDTIFSPMPIHLKKESV